MYSPIISGYLRIYEGKAIKGKFLWPASMRKDINSGNAHIYLFLSKNSSLPSLLVFCEIEYICMVIFNLFYSYFMRKFYLSILVFLTAGSAGFAQQKYNSFFMGFKGGLSIPSLKAGESENDWNKDYESRQGFYFAAVAEYQLSRHFYFQPELSYASEGGRRDGIQPISIPTIYLKDFQTVFGTNKDYLYANLKSVSRLNYFQLPLLIKYQHPIAFKGHLQAFVQAGPYLGFLLVSRQFVESKDLHVYLAADGSREIDQSLVKGFFGSSIDTVIDASSDLHRWNVGVQGGVGLSWVQDEYKLFIEAGGNYGFIPIQKSDAHGKNNIGAATILIGYLQNIFW